MKVDNITVADVAYSLINTRVLKVFQQQLIHVRNGCIYDDPNLPFVKVGTVKSTTQDTILHITNH